MRYSRLGNSGLKVSVVGLGSWLTYGNAVEEAHAKECVRAAVDAGINLFDTADVYAKGEAEACLGRLLAEHRRERLVVATKLFWPMSDDPNDAGLSRKHIMESCAASLRRLRTDYIDLYQCHRYDPETPVDEVVRAMDDLARQGKILYWGVSCWTAEQLEAAVESARRQNALPPISNQPPYNLLQREIEESVIPAGERLGVGQIVYSPLAQGLLTGKYRHGDLPAESRLANDRLNRWMKERMTPDNLARIDRLAKVAADAGVSLTRLALAWCQRQPGVCSTITGATRAEQVRQNASAADVELDEATRAAIEAALA
ncbi:MAG: aldo/keto reductase family protein [Planctomycetes bacterium]|nr:aldo/keto reductase family protein [Planctomycetota bacterium]